MADPDVLRPSLNDLGRSHRDYQSLMQGRRVRLRPITQRDYETLYQIELTEPLGPRWRHRGRTPGPEAFPQTLWSGVLAQFLVVDSSADQPIGIVCAYGAELAHGYAYLAVADFRSAERAPLFFDGIAMFIEYLFTTWPLRKIYFESLEFNAEQFASVFVKLFDIEGTLRDHEFFDGRYWDLVVGALYRESWESNGTRFRRMAFGSDRGLDTGEM